MLNVYKLKKIVLGLHNPYINIHYNLETDLKYLSSLSCYDSQDRLHSESGHPWAFSQPAHPSAQRLHCLLGNED